MSKIIAFRVLKASLRGTEVAIYDYADANEYILGNTSIIVVQESTDHVPAVLQKFAARFPTYFYNPENPDDLEKIMVVNNATVLYTIGYGDRRINDPTLSPNGKYKTALHCVFTMNDPHADTCVPVSKYLAHKHGKEKFVPHMISIPTDVKGNMRDELKIPEGALVFGRYGGVETFNIPFVYQTISDTLRDRDDVWFVFVNTHKFMDPHPRVIHLEPIVDPHEKARFIQTCDAMLHARADGETFGIACGEFSILGRPVITHGTTGDTSHIDILGEKCFTYTTSAELYGVLTNFEERKLEKEKTFAKDSLKPWDAYSHEFGPEPVIRLWWKHLIQPLFKEDPSTN